MTLCGSQMFRRANLALVGLTVLLVSNVAHAAPPTAITTCPFVITTPGQYYLATDLTCPVGVDAISIERVSGVHLQLNGHTLQGLSASNGISATFSTNIVIQGPGTITGFLDGLMFFDVHFSNVIGVTATRNRVGFRVDSADNVFQGNVATLNDHAGISVDSDENTIVNNLSMNNQVGIDLAFANENTIINNLVINNEVGIDLVFANLNKIRANTAISNTLRGISLLGTQNEINGNTALDNGLDMQDRKPDCDENQWRGNEFDTANQSCIQ